MSNERLTGKFKPGGKPWNKGLTRKTDLRLAQIGDKVKGRHTATEFKKGHPVHFLGWKKGSFTPEHLAAMSKAQLGKKNPAHGERIKTLWKTAVFAAKQRDGRSYKPNNSERNLLCLLNLLFPGVYIFTGDFSFMVDGKNPDFISTDGSKKVIELFGMRYHPAEDEKKRIDFFSAHGFSALIVWDPELKNLPMLVSKLKQFQFLDLKE
jgi:hypothetical protein